MNPVTKTFQYGGQTVTLETGRIARQATGAVLITVENTSILCTVVAEKSMRPGRDFFPLAVHYVEKTYAVGKIPGGFLITDRCHAINMSGHNMTAETI